MQNAIMLYFQGEKSAGLLVLSIGILGLIFTWIFYQPRFALRSFAVTLAVFAVIEIAIGVGLFVRTDPQVRNLRMQLQSDPSAFYSEEGNRMTKVQRSFVVIQYIEVAVIIVATLLAFMQKNRSMMSGVALGFLINAAILLAFDIVAERRGSQYLAVIKAQTDHT